MIKRDFRILLVEDHPFQLIALQVLLNNHGLYRLTPVLDANEALIAIERSTEPYDLLLCDQRLPGISGVELIELASQTGMVRNGVLLSGLDPQKLAAIGFQAIARGLPLLGCLSKPLNTLDLLRLVAPVREHG